MVIFLELGLNVIFLIFLAVVFFITLGILSKWFHDFYHTKFTIYPSKPMQLDMKRYKNLLIRISIFYIANNIVGFFLWGRTPFVYLFFYLTTIYEFVAINIYHSFSKIDGKMLYDKNDIKKYTRKYNRISDLLLLLFSILFLPFTAYMFYIFING